MFIFKTACKSYCKNNEKTPGNLLKTLEKSWKYHGILSVGKSENPVKEWNIFFTEVHSMEPWNTSQKIMLPLKMSDKNEHRA